MTKSNWYIVLTLIIVGIISRLAIETFQVDWSYTWIYLSFLTILSTYYGLYAQRQNSEESFDFMMNFKGASQGGVLFALGYGVFTYIFYKFIHPHFLETFVQDRRNQILEQGQGAGVSAKNMDLAIENFNAFAEMIYVPGNLAIITITSLTFLAMFYAVVFSIIANKFPKFINQ